MYLFDFSTDSNFINLIVGSVGVVLVGLGSGIYLTANLGPGPRDGLMTGLQRVTQYPIAWVRVCIEVSVVARSLGRLAGKEVLKRHPHLQEVHGYHPNDFGAIVAAAAAGASAAMAAIATSAACCNCNCCSCRSSSK